MDYLASNVQLVIAIFVLISNAKKIKNLRYTAF